MFLALIAWSVSGRIKGVSGGANGYSQIVVKAGEEKNAAKRGFAIYGSYYSAGSIKQYFHIIAQRPSVLIFAGEVNLIPYSDNAKPTIVSRTFSANKCYPYSLSLFGEGKDFTEYTALSIRVCDASGAVLGTYLGEANSLTSFYDGCTDGWTGEQCDVPIGEEKICRTETFADTKILPELIAILFLE
jgi:hypothetical protein